MNLDAYAMVVVTPVYEEGEGLVRFFQDLAASLPEKIFVVAVDDGSVRNVLDPTVLHAAGLPGVVLRLRRNVGHQRAIAIGLSYIAERVKPEQRVVVMDSDGEDVPSTIAPLLVALEKDDVDVAVAERTKRVATFWFKAFYLFYKTLFALMTGRSISFGNFMALKAHAVKRLVAMQELAIHVAASVLLSKLRIRRCPVPRGPRYAGQSKMNFISFALHGFKALMVFAEDVLVRVGIACAVFSALSVAGMVAATLLKAFGYSTPGWFSMALGILVLMLMETGVVALMTLMLTGVMRSGLVTSPTSYMDFIDQILMSPHGGEAR